MENILVEQRNSFNFLLKKSQKKVINNSDYIDLSNIKTGLMIDDIFEAIKMQEQGWLIRNQIIWYKPNHMPSPVKNRFSILSIDFLFFCIKIYVK